MPNLNAMLTTGEILLANTGLKSAWYHDSTFQCKARFYTVVPLLPSHKKEIFIITKLSHPGSRSLPVIPLNMARPPDALDIL
jgi:hypothetical protein